MIQGDSNMTRTVTGLFTHKQSRSYLNHLVDDAVVGQVDAIQMIKLISSGNDNGRFSPRRNS